MNALIRMWGVLKEGVYFSQVIRSPEDTIQGCCNIDSLEMPLKTQKPHVFLIHMLFGGNLHGCNMASVAPDITSAFQMGRKEEGEEGNDKGKTVSAEFALF